MMFSYQYIVLQQKLKRQSSYHYTILYYKLVVSIFCLPSKDWRPHPSSPYYIDNYPLFLGLFEDDVKTKRWQPIYSLVPQSFKLLEKIETKQINYLQNFNSIQSTIKKTFKKNFFFSFFTKTIIQQNQSTTISRLLII